MALINKVSGGMCFGLTSNIYPLILVQIRIKPLQK